TIALSASGSGAVIVIVVSITQPAASVIVRITSPSQSPCACAVPWPTTGAGDQLYVYGGIPPWATTEADPSHPPEHVDMVLVMSISIPSNGSMVKFNVVSQPFSSEIDTE